MDEIVNRVSRSPLVVFDLEELYPRGERASIDLAQWLEEGIILREKEFRDALNQFDWTPYRGCYVRLYCSTDAVLPAWSYILVGSYLNPQAELVVVGTEEELEAGIFAEVLREYDFEALKGKPVILKGCSNLPIPKQAYIAALKGIQAHARSVSFGEACSAVPIYKKIKSSTATE